VLLPAINLSYTDTNTNRDNKVKVKKRKIGLLRVSLPLLSLFVCNFLALPDKSFSQTNNRSITDENTEDEKLNVMAARDKEINSLLNKAVDLYKHQQSNKAIDLFNQVLRLDPQNASAHFSLGIALEANKDYIGAANHYATAHEIDPANNEYQRAVLNLNNKLEKQRQAQVDEAKQQALAAQARSAFKSGQYEESLSLYKSLEKENPHLAFAKYNIGTIYLILKKPEEALSYYKEAHKLEPKNVQYIESLDKLKDNIKQVQDTKKSQKSGSKKSANSSQQLTSETAKQNILAYCGLRVKSSKNGVLIDAILSGSRAAQVGLQPGDIITVIDGQAIKKTNQLEKALQNKPLGQRFQLLVTRRGQTGQILF
jgi:tetratricopeptide (TPR) repeat protein